MHKINLVERIYITYNINSLKIIVGTTNLNNI